MNYLFIGSLVGFIAVVPLHFLSLEHWKLNRRFGEEKGKIVGEVLGMASGWGLFIFWIGIWLSPQPPIFADDVKQIIFGELNFARIILLAQIPILFIAVWLGFSALKELSIKVSETHRPIKVVNTGIYNVVRHPQYLAGILGHISLSFLLQAFYSLLVTPFVMTVIYFISWKEERELIREFGKDYEKYMNQVPMFIPRKRKS